MSNPSEAQAPQGEGPKGEASKEEAPKTEAPKGQQSYTEWVKGGYSKLPSFTHGSGKEPSDEQKKELYNSLPHEQKEKQSYAEWVKSGYHDQYEKWMPWIEDQYLAWFGKDNKASYVTKDTLNKTKITGISQVDQIQDDVHNLVGNQIGKDGLLNPIGNLVSKEGVNRAERGGKDDSGSYGGPAGVVTDPVINSAKGGAQGISGGAQAAGNTATEGAKKVGGMFGIGGK